MCFCYNQTPIGRMYDFSNKWCEEYGYVPNNTQRKGLNKFASLYADFVEFVFPGTDRKLDIFKSVVELVCEEAPHLKMKTIDGEVINWVFYATTYQNRKYYDSVDRTHKSFKISNYKQRSKPVSSVIEFNISGDFPENFILDCKGMKRRFLSYFIHSINASILRRIIYKMKKEDKVSVNLLHDCITLHPNDVTNFYKVIKQIHTSLELYDIVIYGFFDSVASTLNTESVKKLNNYKELFLSLTTDFKDNIERMNPYHMYSFED